MTHRQPGIGLRVLPTAGGARVETEHALLERVRAHGRAAGARRGTGPAPRVRARRAALPRPRQVARRHAAW